MSQMHIGQIFLNKSSEILDILPEFSGVSRMDALEEAYYNVRNAFTWGHPNAVQYARSVPEFGEFKQFSLRGVSRLRTARPEVGRCRCKGESTRRHDCNG